MFNCHFCGKPSLPRERMVLEPIRTRQRIYPNPNNIEKPFFGSEIVVEKPKCPGCLGTRGVATTLTQEIEAIKKGEYTLATEAA